MLAIDRQRRIIELLQGAGSLRTIETATQLGVTDETVRKDFEMLEKRGELIRTHGGASRPERIREDVPFTERQAVRREEKQSIADALHHDRWGAHADARRAAMGNGFGVAIAKDIG